MHVLVDSQKLTHIRKDQDGTHRVQRVDNRTRRDRVLRRNVAFDEQIQGMSQSYLV